MLLRQLAAIGLLSLRPPCDRRARVFASIPPFSEDDGACLMDEFCVYFVTGNAKKQREVNAILSQQNLSPFRVQHVDIDLPELQGDPIDIAKAKCREAAQRIGGAVERTPSLDDPIVHAIRVPTSVTASVRRALRGAAMFARAGFNFLLAV